MDLLTKVSLDDLDSEHKVLAQEIGIEAYIKLVCMYGGTYLYVPKSESIERNARNECIKSEFTGYNYKELAHKYNLTEVTIRSIVSEISAKIKNAPNENQVSLFND